MSRTLEERLVAELAALSERVRHLEVSESPTAAPDPVTQLVGLKRSTGSLGLTNNYQDVPGCTKTFTVGDSDELAFVIGVFDFEMQYTSSTNVLQGYLNVDGTRQTPIARWNGNVAGEIGTVAQVWLVTLAANGDRTVKLEAKRTASGSGEYCRATTAMAWLRSSSGIILSDDS